MDSEYRAWLLWAINLLWGTSSVKQPAQQLPCCCALSSLSQFDCVVCVQLLHQWVWRLGK
jgi:hypothetical protein